MGRPRFDNRSALAFLRADNCTHTSAGRYLCLICQVLARRRAEGYRRLVPLKRGPRGPRTIAGRLLAAHRRLDRQLRGQA